MRNLLLVALITVAAWFAYGGVGKNQFVLLDDDLHITNNPYLNESQSLWGIWREPYQGLYIPVTYTVWAVQKAVFQRYWGTWHGSEGPPTRERSARFYHWTNFGLHVANTLLVFAILMELVGVPWAALAGALLFCLHPVQVEPIAWISGLKDVLSGFFSFLALLMYLRYSRSRRAGVREGWLYAGTTLIYCLALLAKPSAVVLPFIALALDTLGRGASLKWTSRRLLPWVALALPLAWVAKFGQPNQNISFVAPWMLRPFIASDAITFYFSKILMPLGLAPDYGRNPLMLQDSIWKWLTWPVPILLTLVLFRRKRQTQAAFAVMIVAIFPVLGFVPFYFQEFSTVADRYLYLAMLGPSAWLAWTAARYPGWKTGAGLGTLLVALSLAARLQADHWRDSFSLFTHTIRVNPDSVLCHNNLGTLLEEKGNWLEALYHYKEVIRISPTNLAGHYNSGRLLARVGRLDLAETEFLYVLGREPGIPDANYGYGLVLLRSNRLEEAKTRFFHALQARPDHPETITQLASAFRLQGDCQQAIRYYDAALQRNPGLAEANHGKGLCLVAQNDNRMATAYFERASRQEPNWDAPRQALTKLQLKAGRAELPRREASLPDPRRG